MRTLPRITEELERTSREIHVIERRIARTVEGSSGSTLTSWVGLFLFGFMGALAGMTILSVVCATLPSVLIVTVFLATGFIGGVLFGRKALRESRLLGMKTITRSTYDGLMRECERLHTYNIHLTREQRECRRQLQGKVTNTQGQISIASEGCIDSRRADAS